MAERNQLAKSELVAELITFYHINMLSTFQDNFGEAVIPLTYMYSCAPKRTMTYSSLAPLLRRQRSSGAKGPNTCRNPPKYVGCRMVASIYEEKGRMCIKSGRKRSKINHTHPTVAHLYICTSSLFSALLCHGIKSPTNGTGTQVIAAPLFGFALCDCAT